MIHRDEVLLRLLQANEKFKALRLYQRDTGAPLKEAIDAVDKLSAELQLSSDQS